MIPQKWNLNVNDMDIPNGVLRELLCSYDHIIVAFASDRICMRLFTFDSSS